LIAVSSTLIDDEDNPMSAGVAARSAPALAINSFLVARYRQLVRSKKLQKGAARMIHYYLRYMRYVLAALATVGFELRPN
jgi:hypothetical protein